MVIAVPYTLDQAALPCSDSCVIAKQLNTLLNDRRRDINPWNLPRRIKYYEGRRRGRHTSINYRVQDQARES